MLGQLLVGCLALVQAQPIPDIPDGMLRKLPDGRVVAALPQGYKPNHHDVTTENGGQEHASFLMVLPSGEMLCGWFSGRMEAKYEMNVVLSRLLPNSSQWEKPAIVSHRANYSNQNPLLFLDNATGYLHLYHPSQLVGDGQANSSVLSLISKDGRGLMWTEPEPVLQKHGSFVRGRVISDETAEGRLLLPMYFTPNGYSPETSTDYCAVQVSNVASDRQTGKITWSEIDIKNSSGLAQPSMVRMKDQTGTLKVFFRDRYCGNIYMATSTDNGRTWTIPKRTKLPNNNSGMMAFVLQVVNRYRELSVRVARVCPSWLHIISIPPLASQSGAIAIAFNNAHIGRTPLTVGLSYDGGETWPFLRDLESEPLPKVTNCTCGRGWSPPGPFDDFHKNCNPTFAYPTILQTEDGHIHVSYDHNRQVVWYQRFTEEWVRGGATVGVLKANSTRPSIDAKAISH